MDPPPWIGPYPVERLLGAGAMGSVFLARHPTTQAPLAIKVLHDHDPELAARFAREAQVMARISDPRVVQALDSGLHEGAPYLVLEYCPGQDLAALLKTRGALEPREAATLVAEIGRGLAAAHAAGALHRDLKPANVLLGPQGKPKVADFGLARVDRTPGAQSLTQSGVVLGTPSYMAPEQMHDARAVDVRSDVYALGAILYECLSGKRPFGTGSALAIMERAVEGRLEPLPAELPPALVEVVTCAMARDPADRFSDAALFVEALEDYLAADQASPPRGAGAPLLAGVSLAALALGSALAWLALGEVGAPPEAPLASALPSQSATPSSSVLPPSPSPSPSPTEPPPSASPGPGPFPAPGSPEFSQARATFRRSSQHELRAAAAAGHPAAQTRLAVRVLGGRGEVKDDQRGVRLARAAAGAGDPEAMLVLARHLGGSPEALDWITRAAALGYPHALLSQALTARSDEGVLAAALLARRDLAAGDPTGFLPLAMAGSYLGDLAMTLEACEGGVALGIAEAFTLRARLARTRGGDKEAIEADYERGAVLREPEALCGLARCLLEKPGRRRGDLARGERLLQECAQRNYPGVNLEWVLEHWRRGEGARWREKLVDLGRLPAPALPSWIWGELGVHLNEVYQELPSEAQTALAPLAVEFIRRGRPGRSLDARISFTQGLLLYRNPSEPRSSSMRYFQRAAEAGHFKACHAWGVALFTGDGVEKDVARGLKFLERAGAAGHRLSWIWLGDAYAGGLAGMKQDPKLALSYYHRVSEDARLPAVVLGKIAVVHSTLGDYEKARAYAERAADLGDLVGMGWLGRFLLEGIGGPSDPARGEQLLRELLRRRQFTVAQLPTAIMAAEVLASAYRSGEILQAAPKLSLRCAERAQKLRELLAEKRGRE